ncbi:MAG TPA: M4 family metallopeptidase [Thermoanaerobaculia bacterium]|nr:M4 family metallopeptidase [Thermoanaerobaculia bacterium]
MAAVDIVAHELAHGLADYGPGLLSTGEAGKLSEANADIFAMIVSSHHYGGTSDIPYWIGEQTIKANWNGNQFTPIQAIRYMDYPQASPGTVACYYPGIANLEVHRGAGPADHMFYLLVYGGASACNGNVVSRIALQDAEEIWWNAFRGLSPQATYSDFRQQFIAAAQFLNPGPSTVVVSVVDAFNAVDVTQ